ncbi:MAG: hypothetical protein IH591_14000 [Bacteroidales bacterium]|nr:hypothetical protein [Bacteroidales bacterium]
MRKMDRKRRIIRVFLPSLLIAGMFFTSSCEQYSWAKEVVPEDLVVSYSQNIYPFCQGCHGSWSTGRAFDELSENIDTITPASSRVLSIHSSITSFGSQMIQIDTVLVSAPDMIKLWASQGAPNN